MSLIPSSSRPRPSATPRLVRGLAPAVLLCTVGLSACGSGSLDGDSAVPGIAADLRVSPDVLELGKVKVGESTSADLSVVNLGETDAGLTFALDVTHPETWSFSPEGFVVEADRHEYLTVSLSPQGWGDHSGIIEIYSTSGELLFEVPVSADVDDND